MQTKISFLDFDYPVGNIGCVIMASGLGKRFGENKLMADFNGQPLISHILDITSGIFKKRIVVTRHKDVVDLCQEKDIDVILHSLPYKSDTIRLGLERLSDTKSCMFCTADQPLLHRDSILSLALHSVNTPDKILRPICENNPGSPVVFPQWTYEELLQLPKGQGGGYVIARHGDYVQYIPLANSYELEDIDTQEDFIRLQELSKKLKRTT